MEKKEFLNKLCTYTPEELNKLISSKGTKKFVYAITFITDDKSKNVKLLKGDK